MLLFPPPGWNGTCSSVSERCRTLGKAVLVNTGRGTGTALVSLSTILERTALMCVSCLASLSSGSSSSKRTRTRSALKRDFFGGAGVRVGISSGRSAIVTTSFWPPPVCSGFPSPPSPLLLSGLLTILTVEGVPKARNCSCSRRISASESEGLGRRNIPLEMKGASMSAKL